jgi:hypothetical protein
MEVFGMNEVAEIEEARNRIAVFEDCLRELPNKRPIEDFPLEHVFTPGIYVRTIFIPAGTVMTGKIHRHEHYNILQSGTVSVYSKDGLHTLTGPHAMVSSSGVKRALYAHTDVTWTTFHHNPEELRDLAELEKHIIAPEYAQLQGETP